VSTKSLARTVIEGGRRYHNCWERRHSHTEARAVERVVLARVMGGEDADDLVWPRAKPVRKEFHDKLSPAEQWLRAQVGRPWRKVRSDIASRFDTRTLAGQHIVFDHLLPRPRDRDGTWRVDHERRFFVDRHGILRSFEPPRRRRPHEKTPAGLEELRRAEALAGGRKIVRRGSHLYWLVPLDLHDLGARVCFRQDRELDLTDRLAFEALAPHARAIIELQLP